MMREEGGPDLTIGKGAEDITEGVDPSTTSTQLKWSCSMERIGP